MTTYDTSCVPDWDAVHQDHRTAVVHEINSRLAELYAQNAPAMAMRAREPDEPADNHEAFGQLATDVVVDHTSRLIGAYLAALKKLAK